MAAGAADARHAALRVPLRSLCTGEAWETATARLRTGKRRSSPAHLLRLRPQRLVRVSSLCGRAEALRYVKRLDLEQNPNFRVGPGRPSARDHAPSATRKTRRGPPRLERCEKRSRPYSGLGTETGKMFRPLR